MPASGRAIPPGCSRTSGSLPVAGKLPDVLEQPGGIARPEAGIVVRGPAKQILCHVASSGRLGSPAAAAAGEAPADLWSMLVALRAHQDAYGRLLLDAFEGRRPIEVVERDDGFLTGSAVAPDNYFAPFRRWPRHQRQAMRLIRGRVLDIGCGAGRVALHLQERGQEVVAIDVSPLAVEISQRRGVRDARVLSITDVDQRVKTIDTIVMMGNNFGLLESTRRAKALLRRFGSIGSPRRRIVAEVLDPYATDDPDHLAYHERNRERGRLPGQARIRIRHRHFATPWFDYLFVSPAELQTLIADTGWSLKQTIPSSGGLYVAVLEPT